jgi:hypothetical protein
MQRWVKNCWDWRAKRATILKPPLAKNQRNKNRPASANVIPRLTRNPLPLAGDSCLRGNDGLGAAVSWLSWLSWLKELNHESHENARKFCGNDDLYSSFFNFL